MYCLGGWDAAAAAAGNIHRILVQLLQRTPRRARIADDDDGDGCDNALASNSNLWRGKSVKFYWVFRYNQPSSASGRSNSSELLYWLYRFPSLHPAKFVLQHQPQAITFMPSIYLFSIALDAVLLADSTVGDTWSNTSSSPTAVWNFVVNRVLFVTVW